MTLEFGKTVSQTTTDKYYMGINKKYLKKNGKIFLFQNPFDYLNQLIIHITINLKHNK